MKPFQVLSILLLFAFTLLCTIPANADNLYASIRGTVTDPTGAVVSGVKVTARNVSTGIAFSTTSNKEGVFSFLQLPIGDYTVRAEETGFETFQTTSIRLDIDEVYNLAIKLQLGTVSQVLMVEANTVQVQSTDMQLGTTVTGSQIEDIPLNGRNWTQLQQLQPGVVGTSDRFGGNNGAFSGNGAETQQNSFLINGVDSNDSSLNTALVIPSPDSIGEFRMITSTINPEYGRNSGTIINANIKNGTNQFHGGAFEFYRDTFLDAASYFDKPCSDPLTGQPLNDCRTPFHQNQYGGTIGGPIFKDKAFFFFSFQGEHQRIPNEPTQKVGVYTPDQYNNGEFGASFLSTLTSNPIPFALYGDANSPCPVGGAQCQPGGSTPYTFAQLFSTGNVPTQDFNSLSTKLVSQFVPVNASGAVAVSDVRKATDNQYLGRIDHKLTNNDSIWFYGLWETHPAIDALPFTGTNLPGIGEQQQAHTQQYSFSYTHTFSPTTLNEFRVGYVRFNFAAVQNLTQYNPTTYGFTGITPQNAALANLPLMTVSGLFELGFSNNGPQPRIQNVYQLTDNFSKVAGHHTFKAGINVDRPSIDNPFYNSLSGNYSFNASGPSTTGDSGVDFLLGIPGSYTQGSGSIIDAKAHEIYAYFQDQWQIRPNLTITYGTGYDIETPWVNNYEHGLIMGAWRPGQQSTVFPTAPAGFVYPGDAGINKYGGMQVKYDLLAPRFGFAWSPSASRSWSIHGGIGLYYNRSEEELALQTLTNAPFAITSNGAGSCGNPGFANPFLTVSGATCIVAGSAVTSPFPFTPPTPGATNINFSKFAPVGFGFNAEDPKFTAPRSTNFNLTIERQLDKSTILSVAYVGNRGRHEEGAYDGNMAGSAPGVNPVAAAAGCASGLFLTGSPCPQTTVNQDPNTFIFTNGTPVAGATPYNLALYGQVGIQATQFNSKYDSLQVTLNRRFSKGLQVLAAYTWSRYFDQTSSLEGSSFNFPGVNPFDPHGMWAPSNNDAPQRFVISWTYTLPIYQLAHRFRSLTDGWNLVGIYTLQHGNPIPVFDFFATSLTCDDNGLAFYACPDRADRTSAPLGIRNPRNNNGQNPQNLYFNPAAFTVPAAGVGVGTANRNPLYGPGINYGDIALEKDFHITEQKYFELRLETFNTFNHTNFANPQDSPSGLSTEDVSGILGNFGQVYSTKTISTNGEGRAVQLGAKFYF
jgi:carboxypeptidase family protein